MKKFSLLTMTMTLAITSGIASPVWSQSAQPVQMILLRVEKSDGHEYIISPKGFKAEIPGKGISTNAQNVAVYQDQQGNFWYIDKHGQPTRVEPQVVQSVMAQFQADARAQQAVASGIEQQDGMMPNGQPMPGGAMAPGMVPPMAAGMPMTAPPTQQTTIIQQPASSGSSGGGGGSAAGLASMAMSGTALGMSIGAMANSGSGYYGGVPYGHPIYNEGNRYYYNDANGHRAYVAPNEYNKAYLNQFSKQGTWDNREQWQKGMQAVNPATKENLQNDYSKAAEEGRHFGERGADGAGRGFRRRRL